MFKAFILIIVGIAVFVSFYLSYLHVFVPSAGDDDGVRVVGREPDAGHPVGVTLLLDGVLALGKGVPQLDGLVARSRNNLTIVRRESNTQDILGVIFETAGGLTSSQVPETKSLVPGAGESKVSIGRQNNIGDEMSVSLESLLWNTVVLVITSEFPDNEGLVAGSRQDHVRVFGVGGDLGDPAAVSFEGTTQR